MTRKSANSIKRAKADLTATSAASKLLPAGSAPRLLDNGSLHGEASLAGLAERYGRGETSHTLHVWWARRPHAAMRALVFAALCKETSDNSLAVLRRLANLEDAEALKQAKELLAAQYAAPPRLFDMFGGGGTIPMEAANLGAQSYAIDANQLAVFIQRCNLVYSQAAPAQKRAALLRESGRRVLDRLRAASQPLFPLRERPVVEACEAAEMVETAEAARRGVYAYLWTYATRCAACGYRFLLSRRRWLSKKKGRQLALHFVDAGESQTVAIGDCVDDRQLASVWLGKARTVRCPRCAATQSGVRLSQCEDALVALIRPAAAIGKEFLAASAVPLSAALPDLETINEMEQAALAALQAALPTSALPQWSGLVNPAIYGMRTHADFLSRRQRALLLLLIQELKAEHDRLQAERGAAVARYVTATLSSLIDQLIDWNCRLTMWIAQNEQVGRAFCGPGVAMLWDYVETDPLQNGPANLWAKLERMVAGATSIQTCDHLPQVEHACAQQAPFPDGFFDAIVTDPPYYDNLCYNALADFFYTWKRLLLRFVEPRLFAAATTDDSRELVASVFRQPGAEPAHEAYCAQLALALAQAERVLKPDGVCCLVYSHSAAAGWEALVRAFRATTFRITGVQPLCIERKQRPRAMTAAAVNTCLAFVAHKATAERHVMTLADLSAKLRSLAEELAPQLRALGWQEADIGQALFANGVGALINAASVSDEAAADVNNWRALDAIAAVVRESVASFKLKRRGSLASGV